MLKRVQCQLDAFRGALLLPVVLWDVHVPLFYMSLLRVIFRLPEMRLKTRQNELNPREPGRSVSSPSDFAWCLSSVLLGSHRLLLPDRPGKMFLRTEFYEHDFLFASRAPLFLELWESVPPFAHGEHEY